MNKTGVLLAAMLFALSGCVSDPGFKMADPPPPSKEAPVLPTPEPEQIEKPEPEPPPPPPKVTPKPEIKRSQVQLGIEAYDNGRHREAAKMLRAALASGLTESEQVEAHKYLAFIECSSNRRTQCRNEFRKALAIDPTLELTPAEAGHPVWGPIFRNLKQPKKPRR
jgi:hypothetical protein